MTILKAVLRLTRWMIGAGTRRIAARVEAIRWRRRILRSLDQRRRG